MRTLFLAALAFFSHYQNIVAVDSVAVKSEQLCAQSWKKHITEDVILSDGSKIEHFEHIGNNDISNDILNNVLNKLTYRFRNQGSSFNFCDIVNQPDFSKSLENEIEEFCRKNFYYIGKNEGVDLCFSKPILMNGKEVGTFEASFKADYNIGTTLHSKWHLKDLGKKILILFVIQNISWVKLEN